MIINIEYIYRLMYLDKRVICILAAKYNISKQEAELRLIKYKEELPKIKYTYQNDRNKLVKKIIECQQQILANGII
jgi:hypothetical protein